MVSLQTVKYFNNEQHEADKYDEFLKSKFLTTLLWFFIINYKRRLKLKAEVGNRVTYSTLYSWMFIKWKSFSVLFVVI